MFTHPYATEKVATRYELLCGDLNSDNPLNAAIALAFAAADVSCDGCVTSLDALMILQGCG